LDIVSEVRKRVEREELPLDEEGIERAVR